MEGKQLYEYGMGTNKVTLIKRSGINKVASINGQKKFSLPLNRVKEINLLWFKRQLIHHRAAPSIR
jgi:hypothetical protein